MPIPLRQKGPMGSACGRDVSLGQRAPVLTPALHQESSRQPSDDPRLLHGDQARGAVILKHTGLPVFEEKIKDKLFACAQHLGSVPQAPQMVIHVHFGRQLAVWWEGPQGESYSLRAGAS